MIVLENALLEFSAVSVADAVCHIHVAQPPIGRLRDVTSYTVSFGLLSNELLRREGPR